MRLYTNDSYLPSSAKAMRFSAFTVVNVFDSVLSSSITLARNIPEFSLIGSVDKTVPVVPEERGTWPRLCFPTSWGVPLKAATLEAH